MNMREILSDELMDEIYKKYRFYTTICYSSKQEPKTFDEFLRKELEIREIQIEKLKRSGLHVR
jgi:hypothetical protein